jgi:hypothetical protein
VSELERRTYPPPVVPSYGGGDVVPGLGNPQWVILGLGEQPDGRVRILASDQLDTAELNMVRPELHRYVSDFFDGPILYDQPVYSAKLGFKHRLPGGAYAFWIIDAPSYQEALAHLATLWSVR